MTVIQGVKDYFEGYVGITGSVINTNFLGSQPTQFAIVPLAGERVVEVWLNDTQIIEYPFALQSVEYNVNEFERTNSEGFYEALAEWLDDQSEAGTLPTLDVGKTAEKIEALGWGYLLEDGESTTGVYQIQCKLTYKQV